MKGAGGGLTRFLLSQRGLPAILFHQQFDSQGKDGAEKAAECLGES